jgi:Domain of unknown function (DUF4114)
MRKIFTFFSAVFVVFCCNTADAQYNLIGGWAWNGIPNYLTTPDNIDSAFYYRIQASLPEAVSVPVNHPDYIAPTAPQYLTLLDSDDVYLTYISNGFLAGSVYTWFKNTVGFYTFTGATPPAVIPDSSVTLVLPSCSAVGLGGYMNCGARVYLGHYPAGTKFGFMLVGNGYNTTTNAIDTGFGRFYSTDTLNPEQQGYQKRHVVILFDSIRRLPIIGMEDKNMDPDYWAGRGIDSSDHDMNDAIFYLRGASGNVFDTTGMPRTIPPADSVSSGGTGGLESESLCGAVTKRDFNRIKNGIDTRVNYASLPQFNTEIKTMRTAASRSSLSRFIPDSLRLCDGAYVTTPTDLPDLTIAKDVLSVDYTRANIAKAVVLGITTTGAVYNHTKSICDRFKEATLVSLEKINIMGYDFIRYRMQESDGTPEYTVAFDAGFKKGRNNFNLQTGWLISNYSGDDSVFNFQVWASQPDYTVYLVESVLRKLDSVMPVLQIDDTAFHLPSAYITNGKRNKQNLSFVVNNTTAITAAYIAFDERANESSEVDSNTYPLTLVPGGPNTFNIPVKDGYEYQGYLYLNGKLVDEVYFADGAWSIDYDHSLTQVNYSPVNEPNRVYADNEYAVYRGVNMQCTSADYAIATKFITSGDEKVNLSGYKTLKFHASGTGTATVKLVKAGISKWNDQYSANIALNPNGQDYVISFDNFKSSAYSTAFSANDVNAVAFNFAFNGVRTDLNFTAKSIAFSTDVAPSGSQLQSKALTIEPNPSNGNIQLQFLSDAERTLTFVLTDVAGRVVYQQTVNAYLGTNVLQLTLPYSASSSSLYFVHLGNGEVSYQVQKVTVVK